MSSTVPAPVRIARGFEDSWPRNGFPTYDLLSVELIDSLRKVVHNILLLQNKIIVLASKEKEVFYVNILDSNAL